MVKSLCLALAFLFSVNAFSAAQRSPDSMLLENLHSKYSQAASFGQFLQSLDGLMVENQDFITLMLGASLLGSPPAVTFNEKENSFSVDAYKVKLVSGVRGEFRINDVRFTYDRKLSFAENLRNVNRALGRRKAHALFDQVGVLPTAYAAEDPESMMSYADQFFEKAPDLALKLSPVGFVGGAASDMLLYTGMHTSTLTTAQKLGSFGMKAGVVTMIAGPLYWLSEKAQAVVSTSCDQQVADLKKLLSEQNLSLGAFRCDEPNVTFFDKAGNSRAFAPYWRAGALADRANGELYSFGYDSLKSVKRREDSKSGSPTERKVATYEKGSRLFDQRKAELEPYRKVLFYMGRNMSCMKCEDQISNSLVHGRALLHFNGAFQRSGPEDSTGGDKDSSGHERSNTSAE